VADVKKIGTNIKGFGTNVPQIKKKLIRIVMQIGMSIMRKG